MVMRKKDTNSCESCGTKLIAHETIVYGYRGSSRELCVRCYNKIVADDLGVDISHAEFQPITVKDVDGQSHDFKFVVQLFGAMLSINALEMIKGEADGYQFNVLGDYEDDLLELYMQLYAKICKAMSTKHIEMGDYGWSITDGHVVRARIDCDDDYSGVPLLVIDGKKIPWEEFARMLMSFEGFNFKMQIFDKSEDC